MEIWRQVFQLAIHRSKKSGKGEFPFFIGFVSVFGDLLFDPLDQFLAEDRIVAKWGGVVGFGVPAESELAGGRELRGEWRAHG